jgi:AcrR family transcriptional regulator
MSLREKKKKETINKIIEVSGRLFKEKGFENTTVDEITRQTGIAKGTFFNYFPTKDSLLLYFRKQEEELIFSILETQASPEIPAKEKIKNFFVLLAENYEMDRELSRLLFFEYKRLVIHSKQHKDKKMNRGLMFRKILRDFLKEGMDNGEIKSETDLKAAAEILNAVYFNSLMTWMHPETEVLFSRDISTKVDLIFKGIGE